MDLIIIVLLSIFAVYGLYTILNEGTMKLRDRLVEKDAKLLLILVVKDNEEDIEWVIKRIVEQRPPVGSLANARLIVLDKGSDDDTVKIIERMVRKYDSVRFEQIKTADQIIDEVFVENQEEKIKEL